MKKRFLYYLFSILNLNKYFFFLNYFYIIFKFSFPYCFIHLLPLHADVADA